MGTYTDAEVRGLGLEKGGGAQDGRLAAEGSAPYLYAVVHHWAGQLAVGRGGRVEEVVGKVQKAAAEHDRGRSASSSPWRGRAI